MDDKYEQTPASVNQAKQTRPSIKRSINVLKGKTASSFNGGHDKVIFFKRVMPGEQHIAARWKANIQMLTPLTPSFQKLYFTVCTYWVPDSAVWDNAYEFMAQKGGTSVEKIQKLPNLAGKQYIYYMNESETVITPIYNTQYWRDMFISDYLKRPGVNYWEQAGQSETYNVITTADENALKLRGYCLIHNEYRRNKAFDQEIPIYKTDTVSDNEWNLYQIPNEEILDFQLGRSKRPDSYYTNYRTELQGFEATYPPANMSADTSLVNWMVWEQSYREAISQANAEQSISMDVMSELYGCPKLEERRALKLAERTFELNYSAVTQNAYNSEAQDDAFKVLGKQGAYSFTNVDMLLYGQTDKFKEPGYIHVIGNVWADSTYESGIDRLELATSWDEQYRPDIAEAQKHDVLYEIETRSSYDRQDDWEDAQNRVIGFKRRYSEYFKLNNAISGDMTSEGYYAPVYNNSTKVIQGIQDYANNNTEILPNNTYQFFENNPYYKASINSYDNNSYNKKHWRDYTDLLINKNLAIMEEVIHTTNQPYDSNEGGIMLTGQNQIFYVGEVEVLADLPFDEAIKENFIKWGDH